MSAALEDRLRLRLGIEGLYADYAGVLDDGDYEAWPDFFTEDCSYQVVARENFDQGLPLAAIRCESRGMLRDRVEAVHSTSMYEPRALRHIVSGLRIHEAKANAVMARANFCIMETLNDEPTRVFLSGIYRDALVREAGRLLFRERLCVFDSNLVLNSIVVPV